MTERGRDETFTVRYTHAAPRDLVFECMTTPEHLAHFWGPTGTHTPASTIVADLRPGGVFETTMVNDRTGETHTMRALYVDVRPPSFLSWREVGSGVLTELTFIEADNGTEVVTTQRGLPAQMRTPEARAGWLTALDRAGDYIASIAQPADRLSPTRPNHSSLLEDRMTITDADVQALVGPQFHALAEALAAQPASVADAPSLCDGWAVRHVVAHLTMAARYDGPAFTAELASLGYDFEALSNAIALRDGDLSFDLLLADLRSDTMATWAAPGGGGTGALTHVVIHGLDVTAALGLPRSADDEATQLVLDRLTLDGDGTPFGIDLRGWQLTATDLDWHHGVGTSVSATAEDLVLALAGRPRPGIELRRVPPPP